MLNLFNKYIILGVVVVVSSTIIYILILNNKIKNMTLENEKLTMEKVILEKNESILKSTIESAQKDYINRLNKCEKMNMLVQNSNNIKKEHKNEVTKSTGNNLIDIFNTRMHNVQNNS